MKRITLIAMVAMLALQVQAQPTKRRTTTSNAVAQQGQQKKSTTTTDRAALMFPTNEDMPEDVVWKRDIYRQLDLKLDKNAPLYYPIEPVGTQCNLFTFLFRLFLTGRVSAYNYKLDGNESFEEKDRITDVRELLDRYYIYYEVNGSKYTVADTDVPSAFVTRYYVKESSYVDQRTGTYHSKVTAICPILLETDDFGDASTPKPLFWMKYDDLAPYLSRLPVMASNYNNVTNMTADDFFQMNLYQGDIYKTSNMQGRVLSDYCKTPEEMKAEQTKIETELASFEKGIWVLPQTVDSLDTVATEEPVVEKKKSKKSNDSSKSSTRRSKKSSSSSSSSNSSSSSSSATVSVRRQRR